MPSPTPGICCRPPRDSASGLCLEPRTEDTHLPTQGLSCRMTPNSADDAGDTATGPPHSLTLLPGSLPPSPPFPPLFLLWNLSVANNPHHLILSQNAPFFLLAKQQAALPQDLPHPCRGSPRTLHRAPQPPQDLASSHSSSWPPSLSCHHYRAFRGSVGSPDAKLLSPSEAFTSLPFYPNPGQSQKPLHPEVEYQMPHSPNPFLERFSALLPPSSTSCSWLYVFAQPRSVPRSPSCAPVSATGRTLGKSQTDNVLLCARRPTEEGKITLPCTRPGSPPWHTSPVPCTSLPGPLPSSPENGVPGRSSLSSLTLALTSWGLHISR